MKKVFSVKVFGLTIPVYLKKDLLAQEMKGYADLEKLRIVLDSKLKLDDFKKTLVHEMAHIMFFRLNLQLSEEIEEQICDTAFTPIFENFEINLPPKLQRQLVQNHPETPEL